MKLSNLDVLSLRRAYTGDYQADLLSWLREEGTKLSKESMQSLLDLLDNIDKAEGYEDGYNYCKDEVTDLLSSLPDDTPMDEIIDKVDDV